MVIFRALIDGLLSIIIIVINVIVCYIRISDSLSELSHLLSESLSSLLDKSLPFSFSSPSVAKCTILQVKS